MRGQLLHHINHGCLQGIRGPDSPRHGSGRIYRRVPSRGLAAVQGRSGQSGLLAIRANFTSLISPLGGCYRLLRKPSRVLRTSRPVETIRLDSRTTSLSTVAVGPGFLPALTRE